MERYPDPKDQTVAKLTAFSVDLLRNDPGQIGRDILEQINQVPESYIPLVDGMRNPVDFTMVFDPTISHLVTFDEAPPPLTAFESFGIKSILSIVKFWMGTGVMERSHWTRLANLRGAFGPNGERPWEPSPRPAPMSAEQVDVFRELISN